MTIETQLDVKQTTTTARPKETAKAKPFIIEELLADGEFEELIVTFFQENQELIQEWLDKEENKSIEIPYLSPLSSSQASGPGEISVQNSSEIMEVFENIVSHMQVVHHAGDTKTTIYLDAPQFSNSMFYGSQIQIEEFSTSPKTFNVTFISEPAAASMFKIHMDALMEYFKQKKELPFSIHRLEVNLITDEEPLYRRSDRDNRDNEEEQKE